MEANFKSIIDLLNKQIGDSGLIIHTKALEFTTKDQMSFSECERILESLNNKDFYANNELKKLNIISILLFLQAETNPEKASMFVSKYDQWHNNNKINLRSSNCIDHLHLIFNMIEFEYRFRILNQEKIKLIGMQLSTYEKFEKLFEDFILFKYYDGVIKFLLGDYQSARVSVMEIVIDLCEEIQERKSTFIEYIELKNSILTLKVLEKENDSKEFISHLESLYEAYSKKDQNLSIKFAIKMCDIHLNSYEYDKVFILLDQIFKKIKTQMYFSNRKFPEFVEINLNTICRYIYCSIMFGKTEDAAKFIRKFEKLLNYLKEFEGKSSVETEAKENLLARYQFILFISKYIINNRQGVINRSELSSCITDYRTKFKNTVLSEDDVIINIYSLNSSDLFAKNFFEKIALNMSIIQNNKLVSVNYISLFFSIYNQIAILTKNVTTDTNIKKQLEYIEKIRNCSKSVIDYFQKYMDFMELKIIFSYPYFKKLLIKVFYSYLFSFYFVREYKKVLEIFKELQIISDKLELNKGSMLKHYVDIYKLRADTLFKLEEYTEACNEYCKVISINEESNNQLGFALTAFNLGVSYCYSKEIELSKKHLLISVNTFENLNAQNQSKFNEKINQINNLLQQLNSGLFGRIN